MTESNGNAKIDALVESVSRFPKGFTDSKERLDRIDRSIERQERNIERLAIVSEQQAETTQRLMRVVEGLLEKK